MTLMLSSKNFYNKRLFSLLSFYIALIFLAGCSKTAQYEGTWKGVTEQNLQIIFEVEHTSGKAFLSVVDVEYVSPACTKLSYFDLDGSDKIKDAQFDLEAPSRGTKEIALTGTFSNSAQMKGTLSILSEEDFVLTFEAEKEE